jgi:hypothetical protein
LANALRRLRDTALRRVAEEEQTSGLGFWRKLVRFLAAVLRGRPVSRPPSSRSSTPLVPDAPRKKRG